MQNSLQYRACTLQKLPKSIRLRTFSQYPILDIQAANDTKA